MIGVYIMKHFLKASVCMLLCGTLLCGCSRDGDQSSAPDKISVSDTESVKQSSPFPVSSCGVRLEKAVERAVSLSPATTELICELGFKDRLVGISDYCDFPEGLSAPKVGSTENPDIDTIVELAPDAVFTLSELSERERYTLNQANIAVLTAQPPKNMEGYSALYKDIAAAFYGKETTDSEKGTEKAVEIGSNARLALEKAAKDVSLESFVYVTEKLTVAGADTFENAVLGLSGKNVCGGTGYVSADSITESPQFIIADDSLDYDSLSGDETLSGYIEGGAQVKFVDASAFERPTARTADIFGEISGAAAPEGE